MADVNWYEDKVRLVINKAVRQSAANIAFRIEELTKINIREAPGASGQGLIDTGFMFNSVYVVTEDDSTYNDTEATGLYPDREGRIVERNIAPEEPLDGAALALVAVGAEYAIYQEIEHHFLFDAVEMTAIDIDGLIETF